MVQPTHARPSRLSLSRIRSALGLRTVSTSQAQLDAFRRIEQAKTFPSGAPADSAAAYPGGPPRTIDLTAARAPLPLPYFSGSSR